MIYRVTLIVNPIKVYLMCCFTVQAVLLFSLLAALRSFLFWFFFSEHAWVSCLCCHVLLYFLLACPFHWLRAHFDIFLTPCLALYVKHYDTNRPLHSALHVFLGKPPTNTQSTAAMEVLQSAPSLHSCTHTDSTAFFAFDQPCSALLFSALGAQTSNLGRDERTTLCPQ